MVEKQILELRARLKQGVMLILVTKQVPVEAIMEAYQLGHRDFGENKVQEWLDKKEKLPKDIRWHLIGHLQTNKVKSVVGETELIHSVDSEKLAAAIDAEAKKKNLKVNCLIQVNTSGEQSKFGVSANELYHLAEFVSGCSHLVIKGLMTIGPLTEDKEKLRSSFQKLRELRDEMKNQFPSIHWNELSMGMSSDFEIAAEEGSTMVRVGTAVFGERKK